jgi:microcystin degradation protein MlrC
VRRRGPRGRRWRRREADTGWQARAGIRRRADRSHGPGDRGLGWQLRYKGAYGTGTRGSFGASAAIESDGIQVILSSLNKGIYDLEQLRIFGIEPTEKSVLVVKCMQGHHAAFDPISSVSLDVDSGGLTTVDIARLPFKKVPRPVWPLDDI